MAAKLSGDINTYFKFMLLLSVTILVVFYILPGEPKMRNINYQRRLNRLVILQKRIAQTVKPESNEGAKDTKPRSIPKRIHQTYQTASIPLDYEDMVLSWYKDYPDYEHWFWRDDDIRLLIKRHYPRFLQLFDSYKFGIERSDLGRYLILHRFGGIYLDLDFESFSSFDDYISDKDCVLVPEPRQQSLLLYGKETVVTNSIMMFRPHHELLKAVTDDLLEKPPRVGSDIYRTIFETGPNRFQLILDKFLAKHKNSSNPRQNVHIARNAMFLPSSDARQRGHFQGKCKEIFYKQSSIGRDYLSACADLHHMDYVIKRSASSKAYCDHHWMHLGYEPRDKIQHIPLKAVLGNLKTKMYGMTDDKDLKK